MNTPPSKQSTVALASVFVLAGVVYALISLVNHYLFKTYALDLGLYTHAMYDYIHFRIDDCGMFKPVPQSILADHFDLYLPLLSPLVLVFGTYTLLIVQIAAILLGGWGVYKFVGLYYDDTWPPVLAAACFFFSFGIIHAVAFDYHSNVLAAMMLPWLLYFLKRGKHGLCTLFVVLFVIGKENMSLWLFFIAIGLMWDYRKDKKALWHLAAYAVFAIAYFLVINTVVMPKLGGSGGGFARYAHLGDTYADIARNLLTHPADTLRLLFVNTSHLDRYEGVKEEFYYCIFATGLVFTLLKPNYLFMLVPLIAQKMLSADGNLWGVSLQYSVEFMPVVVIASFVVFSKLKNRMLRMGIGIALLISVVLTTFYTIGVPKSTIMVDQLCVYQARHYRQDNFDAAYARQLMETIPDDAYVCAASMFVPHLALRTQIEDFSNTKDTQAEFVFITEHYFNFLNNKILMFGNRDEFETVATDGNVYLLRRKRP